MKLRPTSGFYRRVLEVMLGAMLLCCCAGCQTFSLSDDDFRKQQMGEPVDRQVGAAVAIGGTAAYYGALIGAVAAGAVK
jgi:hypothetical protein